jgi:hypothetical protein
VTCIATYVVSQTDVDAGSVANTATATGTTPDGGSTVSVPSISTVTIAPDPSLSVVKSASPGTAASYTAGQTITYSFVVTNTGNVTIDDPTVNEGTFTGSGTMYQLTQADINALSVTNDATATGTTPGDPNVTSTPSTVVVPEPEKPSLTVVKSATPATVTTVGALITYSFVVTNTGNVTLTEAVINEGPFSGTGTLSAVDCPPAIASILPGAIVTCTATYHLTQGDVDAGTVTNSATASATTPSGATPVSPTSNAIVTITPASALTIVKSASPSSAAAFTVGQLITYTFVITNTGNLTIHNVAPDETSFSGTGLLSPPTCAAGAAALAPGDQVTCTATYNLTQADIDAGSLTNRATGTGTSPNGPDPVSPPSTVVVPEPSSPSATMVKTDNLTTITKVGQVVTYSFLMTNTGNVTLIGLKPAEGAFTGAGTISPAVCPAAAGTLAPGAFVTCTATYTVIQADLSTNRLANTATVSAVTPSGDPVGSDPSSVVVAVKPIVVPLPFTGGTISLIIVSSGVLLLLLGGAFVVLAGRRPRRRA